MARMNAGEPMPRLPDRNDAFVAAVGTGPAAEYLIREAAAVTRQAGVPLVVLHVEKPKKRLAPSSDRLSGLASLARGLGAEFVTVTAPHVGRAIADFAREKRIARIILGKSRRGPAAALLSPVRNLLSGDQPFPLLLLSNPVAGRREARRVLPVIAQRFPLLEYAAASSALLWNYLFIPPLHTFSIARFEDLFMFVVYFVNAVLVGGLTSRLRVREQLMERGEKKISALYDLSRELGRALDRDGIARAAVKYIDGFFKSRTAVLLPDRAGEAVNASSPAPLVRHEASTLALRGEEAHAAQRAFGNGGPAQTGGDGRGASPVWLVPLSAGAGPLGVLAVRPAGRNRLDLESENFLRGAASLVALALERDAYMRRSEAVRLSEESERLYRTLFNLVSHELRTPLTTITGAASSLSDEAVDGRPETRRALYAEIKKASDRLNLLVVNLLSMSRIESGFLKLEKRPHDLRDLVTAALESLDESGAGRLSLDTPDDLPACAADFEFMKQVFANLLQNAFLYAGPQARVTIAARADGGGVAITVADDGPGWAPETERHLFEKFKRGAGAPAGGLGLGLSICRGIVEAHGGTIAASSGERGGVEIRIRLPASIEAGREGSVKQAGPVILVIDDELQIRRMLRLSLEVHGYAVIDAVRADEGLRLVADAHPDLVILDLELPDKNGLAALKDLRAWSETPVIVLSIRSSEKDKIDLLDAGANDYLTKPFGMGELLARIRGVLRRRVENSVEGVFRTAGIKIDFGRRLVFRGDDEIKLTPTEYSLLRYLAQHVGKIVTHDQLLRELWGPDVEPDASYLRVYVLQLRRKLEDDPSRPKIILTGPGIGYRLAEGEEVKSKNAGDDEK